MERAIDAPDTGATPGTARDVRPGARRRQGRRPAPRRAGSSRRSSEPAGPSSSATPSWPTGCAGRTPTSTSSSAQINTEITTLIATQGPVARDVRELLALYHASAELERMGDYAVNIAKLAQQLASRARDADPQADPAAWSRSAASSCAPRCARSSTSARRRRAASRSATTRSTTSTTASTRTRCSCWRVAPERARQTTHMLFAAHHLERLGDRVTNIGEDVVYLATGQVEDLNP